MIDIDKIPSPCFVVEEDKLIHNLSLIKSVKDRAGVDIILAFKAFALWKTFPIIKKYISCSTASSISEARLAFEEMGALAHTYSPSYTDEDFDTYLKYSSHITFNSISQFERFYSKIVESSNKIECGLRINPEFSVVEADIYNPSASGSRLGVTSDKIGDRLPNGINGLHLHNLCENNSYDLEKTLEAVEKKFGNLFHSIKWFNIGGGHLITHKDYDIDHLVELLLNFKKKYPHLKIILEPGSAFAWQTGVLVSKIVDIVENNSIKTAMLNVSFACHMPDCLEMPYKPKIMGASDCNSNNLLYPYRMGGNSCLSGDFIGDWFFEKPLNIGDNIVFEDMIHYTTVKTTMFNGVSHPSIGIWTTDNKFILYRKFGYEDYKNRMC